MQRRDPLLAALRAQLLTQRLTRSARLVACPTQCPMNALSCMSVQDEEAEVRQAAAEAVTDFAEKAGLSGDAVSRDLVPPLAALASDGNSQVRPPSAPLRARLRAVYLVFATRSFAAWRAARGASVP